MQHLDESQCGQAVPESHLAAANNSGSQVTPPNLDGHGRTWQTEFYPTAYASRWIKTVAPGAKLPDKGSVTFNVEGDVYIATVFDGAVDIVRTPKASGGDSGGSRKPPILIGGANDGGASGHGPGNDSAFVRWLKTVAAAMVTGVVLSVALFAAGCH